MCAPMPPTPPDPAQTIAAQSQANLSSAAQNAELNRVNQNTPYGSLNYTQGDPYADGTPNYTANISLSPQEQQIFDNMTRGQINLGNTALGMQGQVAGSYANPIDTSGQPGINSSGGSTAGIDSNINTGGLPNLISNFGGYGNVQTGLNLSGIPGMQDSVFNSGPNITGRVTNGADGPNAIQQAENAAYFGQTQYLDPQFSQGQEALDNSLINQGITQGSQAYDNAQLNFHNQKQQAYGNAGMQAVQAGQAEQNTLYGQGLSSAQLQNAANAQGYGQGMSSAQLRNSVNQQGFGQAMDQANFGNQAQAQEYSQAAANAGFQNAAQQQGFGQAQAQQQAGNAAQQQLYGQQFSNAGLQNSANSQFMQQLFALRNQPLNEYNSLMTGAQVQSPNFTNVPQANVATTDVGGITNSGYQNQMAAYNASQAGMNNLFSLGGSLGSAAIMASDRRLKRDINFVGHTAGGIPVYDFRYIRDGETGPVYRGVMADEVLPVIPEAVIYGEDGFAMVDYGRIQ